METTDKSYLGYAIKEKGNRVMLSYDEAMYMQIISNAHNLGITPSQYCQMLTAPCSVCGEDRVILSKLSNNLNKQFRNVTNTHLFCFVQSKVNTGLSPIDLKLNYSMAFTLQVSEKTKIYIPQRTLINDNDYKATITLFQENIKTATLLCRVKNNQVYTLTENI